MFVPHPAFLMIIAMVLAWAFFRQDVVFAACRSMSAFCG